MDELPGTRFGCASVLGRADGELLDQAGDDQAGDVLTAA